MFEKPNEKARKTVVRHAQQPKTPRSPRISRRIFLMSSAVTAALATLNLSSVIAPAMAQSSEPVDFARLSAFLTGQNALDATSAQRFFAALVKHDATFPTKAAALLQFIDTGKFPNMDAFLAAAQTEDASASPAAASHHPAMMATATSIVSAWYLGIVGAAADAELITYETSLMYVPTKGVLAVPTYGPGPLAWGETPAGVVQSDVTKSHTSA